MDVGREVHVPEQGSITLAVTSALAIGPRFIVVHLLVSSNTCARKFCFLLPAGGAALMDSNTSCFGLSHLLSNSTSSLVALVYELCSFWLASETLFYLPSSLEAVTLVMWRTSTPAMHLFLGLGKFFY